jgi:hypothetical protein
MSNTIKPKGIKPTRTHNTELNQNPVGSLKSPEDNGTTHEKVAHWLQHSHHFQLVAGVKSRNIPSNTARVSHKLKSSTDEITPPLGISKCPSVSSLRVSISPTTSVRGLSDHVTACSWQTADQISSSLREHKANVAQDLAGAGHVFQDTETGKARYDQRRGRDGH